MAAVDGGRLVDFDAFRRERADDRPPLVVRVGGKDYHLPPDLPAAVALSAIALKEQRGDDGALDSREVRAICVALFGPEQLDEIVAANGLSIQDLADLMAQVIEAYTRGLTPPNRKTRRASRPSRSRS